MNADTASPALPTSRRNFLKLGLYAPLALPAMGTFGLSGCASKPAPYYDSQHKKHYFFLTGDDIVFLQALVPAVLADALPADPQARDREIILVVDSLDRGIDGFGESNQAEIRKLFDLLTFAPTRAVAAGLWSSWDRADEERVGQFLNRWRYSSIGLLNNGYGALVKMVALVDYGLPENWHRSGYPGPPAFALEVLPQFQKEASA